MENSVTREEIKRAVWDCEVDDVVYIGHWSDSNTDTIVQAAAKTGCVTLKAHFSYLGSKVGGLMSRVKCQINTFKVVLSGVDNNGKKSIWVKWNKVLTSKEKGGLGVSSFYALNIAFLFKRVWRFRAQGSSLWARIIKGIHGEDGILGKNVNHIHQCIWLDIVCEMELLKNNSTDLIDFIYKKMGNGADTFFWEDVWRGDGAFKYLYPRVYALETCMNVSVTVKMSHENVGYSLRRIPSGGIEEGSGEFSVASVRRFIDERWLPEVSTKTRWINVVPIKVNVHAWKVRLDCLPTRLNISRRGMHIDSILCPICDKAVEYARHIFFACHIAREVFHKFTG
ncbi:RNA-directed DNA polymerase, eukaryota, reverse transcriptase zinc-binding domain protein [Tanacetum coccineum]